MPVTPTDRFYRARIAQRREISSDLWIVRVHPGGDYSYLPGQYATLGIASREKIHERAYSIVSAPHEDSLEFFLEMVPGGEVSPRLYHCAVGDELTLRKAAKGRLLLDSSSGRTNHLFLATVTGVAPFVSMVRSLYHQQKDLRTPTAQKLFLIDGASRSYELAYREELAKIAAEVDWLTYIPTVSRPWEDKSWKGETGRVDDLVRKYTDSWGLAGHSTTAYLCGHPSMIENTKGILKRHGWEAGAIREEAFFVPAKNVAAS
jgi:ferredoxin/flavodoxin---NADP+ reductase